MEKVKGTPYVSDKSSHYAAAKEWLSAVLSGEEPVALPLDKRPCVSPNHAHLAALAIEHDATVYTRDRGFRRFRGVQVTYPL